MLETIAAKTPNNFCSNPKYIYGLDGLAKLIGCSKATAHKIKNSGQIPFARIGRKFIFNEDNVMAALSVNGKELGNG
jgi:excisionase family DNA binding protein